VRNVRSRSSKVVNFDTNRKRVCDFLLVIISNLGPILLHFRDIAGFLQRTTTSPSCGGTGGQVGQLPPDAGGRGALRQETEQIFAGDLVAIS